MKKKKIASKNLVLLSTINLFSRRSVTSPCGLSNFYIHTTFARRIAKEKDKVSRSWRRRLKGEGAHEVLQTKNKVVQK